MSRIGPVSNLHHQIIAAPAHSAGALPLVGAPRKKRIESIKQGFDTMESRFKPSEAKGLKARIQFIFTGAGGGEWFVVIENGKCTVKTGKGENPDTTLSASASDYLKIQNGEMNKVMAMLQGKFRVSGDLGKVRPFFACFEKV